MRKENDFLLVDRRDTQTLTQTNTGTCTVLTNKLIQQD